MPASAIWMLCMVFLCKIKGEITMIDISLNKITINYGFGDVLKDVSLDINRGEIVSLIGPNGSGKTTILKLIMGIEIPTSGTIAIRKNTTIGYLSQMENIENENRKVKDILYKSINNILNMENTLKKYEEKMTTANNKELEKIISKYTNLQEQFMNLGGYEINEKIGKIVKGFKIEHLLDSYYNTLSGVEKRIVSFAALMIKNPDILLLDEPTNHLDIDTLEWLEKFLKSYKGTILFVSHDRYFLDRISNKIIFLDDGILDIYYGNYTYFLEENEKRIMLEFKDYKDQQKQMRSMKESIKKLRYFGYLGNNERFFKRAKAIEKRLEKMEKLNKRKEKTILPLEFNLGNRSGEDVLVISHLNIGFDSKTIFDDAHFTIKYKDHVCLMGKNGSGKSTLIREIVKKNDSIKLGTNINIGYIPQEITFDNDKTIYEIARKSFKGEESHLRSALFKFMFTKNTICKRVSKLSGGEKVRLKLFCLMQENINFLILDEPTNHMDITTREILEDTLNGYDGTILFVSHDRCFINKIANKIVNIQDNKLVEYIGNYDDYKDTINRINNK